MGLREGDAAGSAQAGGRPTPPLRSLVRRPAEGSLTSATVLAALSVGVALAGTGALLLGRRPRSHGEWNEAFLAGGGAAAILLFPLSIAFPHRALWILLVGIFAAAAGAPFLPRTAAAARRPDDGPGWDAIRRTKPVDALLLLGIFLSIVAFLAANGRYHLLWDGFFIWSTKAMLLLDDGGLAPELWYGSAVEGRVGRVVGYPPLVPLLEALVGGLRGGFDFDDAKPVFVLFFLSLLSGTWSVARAILPRRRALVATALVAALPGLSTFWAAGGYADMPQAAVLVTLVAALLRGEESRASWRHPVPWLLGALVSVKNEGMVLAVLVLAAWGTGALLSVGLARTARAARDRALPLLLAALFLSLRTLYVRWTVAPGMDNTYFGVGPSTLWPALRRLPELAPLVGAEMARVWKWGLLWPAFLGGGAVLLGRREPVRRVLAAATLAAVAAYVSTFLFTNWALEVHVSTALDRILSQLAPLAVLVAVAGLTPPEEAGPA